MAKPVTLTMPKWVAWTWLVLGVLVLVVLSAAIIEGGISGSTILTMLLFAVPWLVPLLFVRQLFQNSDSRR